MPELGGKLREMDLPVPMPHECTQHHWLNPEGLLSGEKALCIGLLRRKRAAPSGW